MRYNKSKKKKEIKRDEIKEEVKSNDGINEKKSTHNRRRPYYKKNKNSEKTKQQKEYSYKRENSSSPRKPKESISNIDKIIEQVTKNYEYSKNEGKISDDLEQKVEKKVEIIEDIIEETNLDNGSSDKTVEIKFVGKSSEDVTGSMILVKSKHRKILLECGLYQGGNDIEAEYNANSEKFDFNPRELDYIFVCHNHTDHLGLVPRLFKEKTFAQVIVPENSISIAKILMNDCAKIMAHDAKDLEKLNSKRYDPIYTPADVEYTLKRTLSYPIGERIVLDEYVSFRFVPSGHIMNSCQLELFITEDDITKKILYTSDLGNTHIEKDYVTPFSPVHRADIVIGESTYGNCNTIATQKTRREDLDTLKKVIDTVIKNKKGTILIPVFANDRCQTMMTELYKLYGNDKEFKLNIYVDSPMAANICDEYYDMLDEEGYKLFEKVCDWKNMHIMYTREESKKLLTSTKSKIILASSGMLDQGKSKLWFEKICKEKSSFIVFCGYSVEGTLASKVKTQLKEIEHEDRKYILNCKVVSLDSYSSHMQKDSLIKYYSSIHTPLVYLVHGEVQDKKHLAKILNKQFRDENKERQAICASKGMTVRI